MAKRQRIIYYGIMLLVLGACPDQVVGYAGVSHAFVSCNLGRNGDDLHCRRWWHIVVTSAI